MKNDQTLDALLMTAEAATMVGVAWVLYDIHRRYLVYLLVYNCNYDIKYQVQIIWTTQYLTSSLSWSKQPVWISVKTILEFAVWERDL